MDHEMPELIQQRQSCDGVDWELFCRKVNRLFRSINFIRAVMKLCLLISVICAILLPVAWFVDPINILIPLITGLSGLCVAILLAIVCAPRILKSTMSRIEEVCEDQTMNMMKSNEVLEGDHIVLVLEDDCSTTGRFKAGEYFLNGLLTYHNFHINVLASSKMAHRSSLVDVPLGGDTVDSSFTFQRQRLDSGSRTESSSSSSSSCGYSWSDSIRSDFQRNVESMYSSTSGQSSFMDEINMVESAERQSTDILVKAMTKRSKDAKKTKRSKKSSSGSSKSSSKSKNSSSSKSSRSDKSKSKSPSLSKSPSRRKTREAKLSSDSKKRSKSREMKVRRNKSGEDKVSRTLSSEMAAALGMDSAPKAPRRSRSGETRPAGTQKNRNAVV
ncbi:MAG: hypothetical protein SGILL_004841 [Bacillariaceae sp.]